MTHTKTTTVRYAGHNPDREENVYAVPLGFTDLPPIAFARLIAAAPELLEAVEAFVPLCPDCKGTGKRLVYADPSNNPGCTQPECVQARAAIIKATEGS